jgi:glucokinase
MTVLAGDIGGTKTVLALYEMSTGLHKPTLQKSFPSAEHDSLDSVIAEFLRDTGATVSAAAFGVAGPVLNGAASITNLPWKMSESGLAATLNAGSVKLLNDLESIANAIPALSESDIAPLNTVQPTPNSAMGVVAPGTGLGEAFLVSDGAGNYSAHPSEGGHCDFAPNTDLEIEMLRYLLPVFDGHVSYERVCSGIGIPNIYNFMRWSGVAELSEIETAVSSASDPTPVIMTNAMSPAPSPRCKATLDMFCSVLAAQAGNLALTVMATGGLYLGGGIPPRILPALQHGAFLQSFLNKGRLRILMERVPLRVITNPNAALLGAARVALGL